MATPQLDHIVVHVPLELVQSPPDWLTSKFTVSPGGTHGDGKTTNKLIVFKDGTYLELIAFTSPDARAGHWWGDKGYGIIDYAFTYPSSTTYADSTEPRLEKVKLALGPGFEDLVPGPLRDGSRLTPSGERIAWHVAFPAAGSRGGSPFWCFDQTPRERRVSVEPAATMHPSRALGVHSLSLLVGGKGTPAQKALAQVLDASIPTSTSSSDQSKWELDTVHKADKVTQQPRLLVKDAAPGSKESRALEERGRKVVAKLALFIESGSPAPSDISHEIGDEGDELIISFTSAA